MDNDERRTNNVMENIRNDLSWLVITVSDLVKSGLYKPIVFLNGLDWIGFGFRLSIYNPDLQADWYMVVLISLMCYYNYGFIDVNLVAK